MGCSYLELSDAMARLHLTRTLLAILFSRMPLACTDWEGGASSIQGGGAGGAAWTGGGPSTGGRAPNNCAVPEAPPIDELPSRYPAGLHVVSNTIRDAEGNVVVLRGVNRSGTEYKCAQSTGIFDGPSDEESVRAIASWNVNAVRVPLNESCWLGVSSNVDPLFSGEAYKKAIIGYVSLLHKYALVPILELHFAAPGDLLADKQWPLPNLDNTPTFWADVAATFSDDTGVVFEPYNEPFPGNDNDANWACWRDGCSRPAVHDRNADEVFAAYDAVGMQGLVDAIRDAERSSNSGVNHLILLGGLAFANNLSQWIEYRPTDPDENLAAAWHVYNFNACTNLDCNAASGDPGTLAEMVPVVATEIGEDDCSGQMIEPLMKSMDEVGMSYLAWWWNTSPGSCVPATSANHGHGGPLSLIEDYVCPIPKGEYGQAFYNHLRESSR
jgi:endoglucanase